MLRDQRVEFQAQTGLLDFAEETEIESERGGEKEMGGL